MQILYKPQSAQFFPARRSFYLLFGQVIVLRITMAHGSGTLCSLLPVIFSAPSLSYKPSAEDAHAEDDETRGNPLGVLGAGSRALHACVARNGFAAPGGTDAFQVLPTEEILSMPCSVVALGEDATTPAMRLLSLFLAARPPTSCKPRIHVGTSPCCTQIHLFVAHRSRIAKNNGPFSCPKGVRELHVLYTNEILLSRGLTAHFFS